MILDLTYIIFYIFEPYKSAVPDTVLVFLEIWWEYSEVTFNKLTNVIFKDIEEIIKNTSDMWCTRITSIFVNVFLHVVLGNSTTSTFHKIHVLHISYTKYLFFFLSIYLSIFLYEMHKAGNEIQLGLGLGLGFVKR